MSSRTHQAWTVAMAVTVCAFVAMVLSGCGLIIYDYPPPPEELDLVRVEVVPSRLTSEYLTGETHGTVNITVTSLESDVEDAYAFLDWDGFPTRLESDSFTVEGPSRAEKEWTVVHRDVSFEGLADLDPGTYTLGGTVVTEDGEASRTGLGQFTIATGRE